MSTNRIKELMEQADYNAPGGQWKEYFAELLVKECANVVLQEGKKIADAMPQTTHDNYIDVAVMTGRVNSAVDYAVSIREHFGVDAVSKPEPPAGRVLKEWTLPE